MPESPKNYVHLHLVSDATGETLIAVSRAAAAQYATVRTIEHVYPLVRSGRQLDRILREIEEAPGMVLYTLVNTELATRLEKHCRELALPVVSVLAPVLDIFRSYLGAESTPRIGGQHTLNQHYFRRIDALNYTMVHDDGQNLDTLDDADVVLIGISRTSKTPTSFYLANRGIKTANVPIVLGVPVPQSVIDARHPLVVGLVATAERVSHVRQNRVLGTSMGYDPQSYVDRSVIAQELGYARQICVRHGWPMIDVSRRSIEETAAAIVALRGKTR